MQRMGLLSLALRSAVRIAVLSLAIATALSFMGGLHWSLDLLTHFRVQYLGLAAIALVAGVLTRSFWASGVACVVLLLNAAFVLPEVWPARQVDGAREPAVSLLVANVLTSNSDVRPLQRLIQREAPDIVGLLEVDARWVHAMRYLRGRYPHHLEDPRSDNFGLALYSRLPFTAHELVDLAETDVNAALVRLEVEGRPLAILLAHSLPPAGSRYSSLRNAQLADIARVRRLHRDADFVVVGDLNTAPWSPHYRSLVGAAELRSAARGHGLVPTWPAQLIGPLRIPIDHGLISPGLRALSFRPGPPIGSDHLPILLDVAFAGSDQRSIAGGR